VKKVTIGSSVTKFGLVQIVPEDVSRLFQEAPLLTVLGGMSIIETIENFGRALKVDELVQNTAIKGLITFVASDPRRAIIVNTWRFRPCRRVAGLFWAIKVCPSVTGGEPHSLSLARSITPTSPKRRFPTLSTALGNPAQAAGFPHSHSYAGGRHSYGKARKQPNPTYNVPRWAK